MLKPVITIAIASLLTLPCVASSAEMQPRGKGTAYWKRVIKVYDAQLIAPADATAENILDDDVSKCLLLTYRVPLDAGKIISASNIVLERQHTAEVLATIKDDLKLLVSKMQAVEKGDQYQLCYDHLSKTLSLELNNELKHESQSALLAKLYLGIWLNENLPISKKLRLSLLE